MEFNREEQRYFIENIILRNTKVGYVISDSQKLAAAVSTTASYCNLSIDDANEQMKQFILGT